MVAGRGVFDRTLGESRSRLRGDTPPVTLYIYADWCPFGKAGWTVRPLRLGLPLPSKDGKKLFVVGRTSRGGLVRYDSKSGQFVPFLSGISAEYVAFSKDGHSVAYVTYAEGTLWRSKPTGSERVQLSYPPLHPVLPR